MKCVSCILLLCLSTLTAGQTVNLLKSIGLSQKTISGITVASESDSYRQSGVSSPAYSFDGVDKTLAVSSSDATTILAGVGQTEYSVATLIRRTKRLTSGQSGSIVLFSIKSPSGLETRLEIRMVYELRKNDRSCPASCHDLRIEVERSGSVTTFVDNDLFNDLTDVSVWRYLVVVFRVQAAGADIGRSNAEIVVYLDCTSRRQAITLMPPLASDSVVTICGSGVNKCDNIILQDFQFRDRGYSYSDSKIYCPATRCNTDCVEDRTLIRKEIEQDETKQATLAVKLVECEDRYPPEYCVTATGDRIDVGQQYDESSSMRCTCRSHLNLECIPSTICKDGGNTYFPGDEFAKSGDKCRICTCQSDGTAPCKTVSTCPNPDCSMHKDNPKVITPAGSCCSVCEADYCKHGTVYKTKGLDCTEYPTCDNVNGVGCTTKTKPGCVCKKGRVFDDTGVCIRKRRCPCKVRDNGGIVTSTLNFGFSDVINGRLCVCETPPTVTCYRGGFS